MKRRKFLILTAQGLAMIGVAFAPFYDPGYFDFSLLPFAWHKTIGFVLNLCGFVICLRGVMFLRSFF